MTTKDTPKIKLLEASGHNLKKISATIPHGRLSAVTGVSGSGKSSLILETLYPALRSATTGRPFAALPYSKIEGVKPLKKVMKIDQKPIGRTPRSNPATYTGIFSLIRQFYADIPEAQTRGYSASRFSFNVGSGRCEKCQGDGVITLEMHFLPDVFVLCEHCRGRRYNQDTLEVMYRGHSIADILEMTIDNAVAFFENHALINHKLKILQEVGLGYLTLGQGSPSLSGGESQRLKLARELSKLSQGETLYILDEPTTGLHLHDIHKLLECLQRLVDKGNTVLVIEHHRDVIQSSDWIIDLGPEGGSEGGHLIYCGPTSEFENTRNSHTAKWLHQAEPTA